MLKVGFCEAGIEVEGKQLEEYGTEIDGRTATSWVESEIGKEFSIIFKASTQVYSDTALRVSILFDGSPAQSFVLAPEEVGKEHKFSNIPVGKGLGRPFLFSKLALTDNEDVASPLDNLEDLGVVKVTVVCGTSSSAPEPAKFVDCRVRDSPVHERAKKIATHRISLGEEAQFKAHWYKFIPRSSVPVAEFKFLYGPSSFLKAQGLVPSDPPRPQAPGVSKESAGKSSYQQSGSVPERKGYNLPADEDQATMRKRNNTIRHLRQQQNTIERRLAELKDDPRQMKRIKTETKPDPEWSNYKIDTNGVIDLTVD